MIDQPIEPTNQPNQQLIDWDQPTEWLTTTAWQGRETLAKAETNWEAIDQTIIITANIADGIG